jgi:tRNA A22 N-methylase
MNDYMKKSCQGPGVGSPFFNMLMKNQTENWAKANGYALVPVEPAPEVLTAMKEKHWDIRGVQLCEEDYLDIYKVIVNHPSSTS